MPEMLNLRINCIYAKSWNFLCYSIQNIKECLSQISSNKIEKFSKIKPNKVKFTIKKEFIYTEKVK